MIGRCAYRSERCMHRHWWVYTHGGCGSGVYRAGVYGLAGVHMRLTGMCMVLVGAHVKLVSLVYRVGMCMCGPADIHM